MDNPEARHNNGMQRSADTQALMLRRGGRAPADAWRYASSLTVGFDS